MRSNEHVAIADRRLAHLGFFILCGVVALSLIPLAWLLRAGAGAVPTITDYISKSGDQVVTVPNGIYTGGTVTAAHPETAGPYKGWLVLVAQSPRGVVVDMTKDPLIIDNGSSRVLFVGFKFINGTMSIRGDDIAFWYTEHSFPIEEWNRQFQAAGGNEDALNKMANPLPKAIWIGESVSGRSLMRTQIIGADVHDVGDDGIYVDKSMNGVVQGTRIWNVEEKNYDPGYNPWNPNIKDLIHNDGLQIPGAVYGFTMADSYVGQTITVGGDNAPAKGLTWRNLWLSRADGVGMLLYTQNGYQVTGSMQNIRSWSEGYKQNPYDSGWDQLRVDIANDKQATWPSSLNDPNLQVTSAGDNYNQQAPSGVTMSGGRMNDQSQALDNPQNPANVWRAAHPYNSWPNLLGLPTDSKTTPPPVVLNNQPAAPLNTTTSVVAPTPTTVLPTPVVSVPPAPSKPSPPAPPAPPAPPPVVGAVTANVPASATASASASEVASAAPASPPSNSSNPTTAQPGAAAKPLTTQQPAKAAKPTLPAPSPAVNTALDSAAPAPTPIVGPPLPIPSTYPMIELAGDTTLGAVRLTTHTARDTLPVLPVGVAIVAFLIVTVSAYGGARRHSVESQTD